MEKININDCPIALSWHEAILHCLLGGDVYTWNDGDSSWTGEELYTVIEYFFQEDYHTEKTMSLWDDPEDTSWSFRLVPPVMDGDRFEFRLDSQMYGYLNELVRDEVKALKGLEITFEGEGE